MFVPRLASWKTHCGSLRGHRDRGTAYFGCLGWRCARQYRRRDALIQEATDHLLNGESLPADIDARLMALSPADRIEVLIFLRRSGMMTGPGWTADRLLSPATIESNKNELDRSDDKYGNLTKAVGNYRRSGPDRAVDGDPYSASVLDFGIALSIATATLILVMASLVERPTDFQAFSWPSAGVFADPTVAECIVDTVDFDERPEWTHRRRTCDQWLCGICGRGVPADRFDRIRRDLDREFHGITRARRMAEVSARFALIHCREATLAIDGDLNSGAIDHEEAKAAAYASNVRSAFWSCWTKIKFVKGDAIAGLVITMINLFVGRCWYIDPFDAYRRGAAKHIRS